MLNINPVKAKSAPPPYNHGARPLRVALLSHSGGLYGAERALLRLAIGLARRPDFRPLVLVPFKGPLHQRCRDYGIAVAVVGYPKWLTKRHGNVLKLAALVLRSLWAWRPLMARLRRFQPDVVYSNTAANPMGALAARRLRVGHVWHLHEFAGEGHRTVGWSIIQRLLNSRRTRLVCNSASTREHYAKVLRRGGIERIYNGLDFAPVPKRSGTQKHNECVLQADKVELLVVAGIRDSKGHKDAVRATAKLREQGLAVQLTIAGVGDDKTMRTLQNLVANYGVQDSVKFVGFVDNTAPLYKRAALTLVCGCSEGFGSTAVESMAWGTPVIAADAGGLPEIIRQGRTGMLYAPGNWHELADCIQTLIENEEQYAKLSATGIDWVRQSFPARRYVREMAELLTRAAITRRPQLRGLYRDAITALPRSSMYGGQA